MSASRLFWRISHGILEIRIEGDALDADGVVIPLRGEHRVAVGMRDRF
ncbi:hypothetical protein [Halobellus salinisoli]